MNGLFSHLYGGQSVYIQVSSGVDSAQHAKSFAANLREITLNINIFANKKIPIAQVYLNAVRIRVEDIRISA
jgi:hypothetical protein